MMTREIMSLYGAILLVWYHFSCAWVAVLVCPKSLVIFSRWVGEILEYLAILVAVHQTLIGWVVRGWYLLMRTLQIHCVHHVSACNRYMFLGLLLKKYKHLPNASQRLCAWAISMPIFVSNPCGLRINWSYLTIMWFQPELHYSLVDCLLGMVFTQQIHMHVMVC